VKGSLLNASQSFICRCCKADRPITDGQLHWLTVSWQRDFKLTVFVYKCLHHLAPSYLADELHHPAASEFRRRLRSASSLELSVPRTRNSTYGDRAVPVAAVQIWNSLPAARHIHAVTSRFLHSLEDILLRTVLFIKLLSCLRSDIVILDTLIVLLTYLILICIWILIMEYHLLFRRHVGCRWRM